MLLKNNLNELKSTLKANNILTGTEECYCYATDALNVPEKTPMPEVVTFVETVEDVKKIIKFANKYEVPVISRGAGTNMVGACLCPKGGIVLNFSKMNKILNFEKENMTITVQPGVVLGDLKDLVEKEGLFFPPDPSNYKVSTIGGAIAQSSGGAMAYKYGTIKDYILSLKVVTSNGELMTLGANTIKDAVGYHLSQLIVGSEGTLAVVVEATLKLIPKPETVRAIAVYFDDINVAVSAIDNIIESRVFPAAIDFMDKNAILTVEKYANLGLKTDSECMLIISVDGYESIIDYQIKQIQESLEKSGVNPKDVRIACSVEESDVIWQARRVSYAAATALAPDIVTDDIIVPRNKLGEMITFCNSLARKYSLKMCIVGHVGDGNLHPQIVLNMQNKNEYANCLSAKKEMYEKAVELGGTISSEHGIGIEKKEYVTSSIDKGSLEYMKAIKKIFDPKNILNPCKIFDI